MSECVYLGRDLTEQARAGGLDPVVGRERELDQMLRILSRRTKSNPLLLGEPGVGKSALVEGLAQRMASGDVPRALLGRRLFELQLGSLMAGTQYRGDLEKRVQDFLRDAQRDRTLVFIDEIHLIVVAGRGSGMDAANLLKPILARGAVPCNGATTPTEAAEMFRIDPAMERRFQTVMLDEPDAEAVRIILTAARPRLEAHHGFRISDEAIQTAVELSLQQNEARRNPDRALDILEDACAAEQLCVSRRQEDVSERRPEVVALQAKLQAALESLDLLAHVRARSALDTLQRDSRVRAECDRRAVACVSGAQVRAAVASGSSRPGNSAH